MRRNSFVSSDPGNKPITEQAQNIELFGHNTLLSLSFSSKGGYNRILYDALLFSYCSVCEKTYGFFSTNIAGLILDNVSAILLGVPR